MTAIKENSTRNYNKGVSASICPVTYAINRIGGHWKPIILYQLRNGALRYSEIRRAIPTITEKMLIQHLKQLQEDNIVIRKSENTVPPFVTYHLSPSGEELTNVLNAMAEWGIRDSERNMITQC